MDKNEAVPVFFLGGQPFIYADVGFEDFEGVARDAYVETNRAFSVYMGAWVTNKRLVEDGRTLTESELYQRLMELAGGLGELMKHLTLGRVVHAFVPLFIALSFLSDYT